MLRPIRWANCRCTWLLIQNWGLTGALSWNHPAWSISTEFAAYLVFPALVLMARWDRVPSAVLLGLAAHCSLAVSLCCSAQTAMPIWALTFRGWGCGAALPASRWAA
jgi:peptidoglycan/LPS O-acetylase OafA/YrhL